MKPLQVISPYPQFFDHDGTALDNGYVYIGEANENPETDPINIYSDYDRTIAVAQPIRTLNGYPTADGSTPINIYFADEYSITVRDRKGALIYTAPVGYGNIPEINPNAVFDDRYEKSGVQLVRDAGIPTEEKTVRAMAHGGVFVWDSASTLVDDGVTILKPTAVGVGAAGRWLLTDEKYEPPSVAEFKAAYLPSGKRSIRLTSDDGGVFLKRDGLDVADYPEDGNGSAGTVLHRGSEVWIRDYSGAAKASWFGISDTGDQTANIQNLVDLVDVIDFENIETIIDSEVLLRGGNRLRNINVDATNAPDDVVTFNTVRQDSSLNNIDLTFSANKADDTITVDDASSFAVGDWVILRSDKLYSNNVPFAEFLKINNIDGNELKFASRLEYEYLTADNANLYKLEVKEPIHIQGKMKGDGLNQTAIELNDVISPVTSDLEITGYKQRAVQYFRCINGRSNNVYASGSNKSGLGYGIATIFCLNHVIRDSGSDDCRHFHTIGGTEGITTGTTLINCTSYGSSDADFDSHSGGNNTTYINCTAHIVEGTTETGFIYQGSNPTYIDCKVRGGAADNGFFFQPNLATDNGVANHAIYQNCRVEGGGGTSRGIYLQNIADNDCSIEVSGGSYTNVQRGIYIYAQSGDVSKITINGVAKIESSADGIRCRTTRTDGIKSGAISGNNIALSGATDNGVYLQGCKAIATTGNTIDGGSNGVNLFNSADCNTGVNIMKNYANLGVKDNAAAGVNEQYGNFV